MSKWIDERAWTVSVYICYILEFIVLSVAGYHCAISLIGSTSLFMKAVILICVCLIVALIVSLVFSIFITPISELLLRLLKMLQRRKSAEMVHNVVEEEKNTLKSQFVARFVTEDHKNEPIYDTIDQVLHEKGEGAFAARVAGCAANAPLNWLKTIPTSKEMVNYFGLEAINSESSFNGGLTKFRKDSFKEGSNATAINIMKDKLKELQNKKLEEQKNK